MICEEYGLIDTHCHLTDEAYDEFDVVKIIDDSRSNGVVKMICVATSIKDSKKVLELAGQYPFMYGSIGLHPSEVCYGHKLSEADINLFEKEEFNHDFIAIGECGLDFSYPNAQDKKKEQMEEFEKQIRLSVKLNKPLLIHTREAHPETKRLLRKYPTAKGLIHCFVGSYEDAMDYIELGFYISFSGILTFKQSKELVEVAKKIPLNRILIETDSPYLTPEPYRGKINFPYYVKRVAQKLAIIHGLELEDIIKITYKNTVTLFNF